jgi:hypothetical protein
MPVRLAVFKSVDRGDSWTLTSFGPALLTCASCMMDQTNALTLYAGSSAAGSSRPPPGERGLPSTPAWETALYAVAMDSLVSSTVYAGTGDRLEEHRRGGELDAGERRSVRDGPPALAVFGFAGDCLRRTRGGGVSKSVNGGAGWAPVNNGLTFLWSGAGGQLRCPRRSMPDRRGGVFKSVNGAAS